jgi:ribosomal protein L12E/L44/L45/RPP1/RPP2
MESLPPTVTRGEFTIHASPIDVWNAIGDIVVRTPQASYDTRSQMIGLYSVRYKDQPLLILAHGLPLSDTVHELTTQVTAKSTVGIPVDNDVVAELLSLLQQQLPAEIEHVHARQLAADAAAAAAAKKAKAHKKKSRRKK